VGTAWGALTQIPWVLPTGLSPLVIPTPWFTLVLFVVVIFLVETTIFEESEGCLVKNLNL
jgi:hypothetical protein